MIPQPRKQTTKEDNLAKTVKRTSAEKENLTQKMTPKKTTPTEYVPRREQGLDIHTAKLTGKPNPEDAPLVTFTTGLKNLGKKNQKIDDTTAKVSEQYTKIEFTEPQQVQCTGCPAKQFLLFFLIIVHLSEYPC